MSRLSAKTHPLLDESVIDSLFGKNIFTTSHFIQAEIKQLTNVTGLTYKNVLAIRHHIINKNSAVTRNGLEYYSQLAANSAIIPTKIENVDVLLDGGLTTGNIYEICGLPASGKTQFCLTTVKNVVRNFDQCVYYLDTKGDFNAKRIKIMLEADKSGKGEIGSVMEKILVKHLNTKYDLVNTLHSIKNEITNGLKLRLIVIDSLPPLFFQYLDVQRCNGILNQAVNVMRLLAVEYHIAFVVSNTLTTWYEGSFGEDSVLKEKIGCGKYWLSVPNTRLKIGLSADASGEKREISVLKTNKLTEKSVCDVVVNDSGIV